VGCKMDSRFILALKAHSWLKWFCCPHCGSNSTISKNGRCTICDEQLVLVREEVIKNEIIDDIAENNSNFLMPWEPGPSFYYHVQWIQWAGTGIEVDIS
jgi:uncharacterized protein with PIN domain